MKKPALGYSPFSLSLRPLTRTPHATPTSEFFDFSWCEQTTGSDDSEESPSSLIRQRPFRTRKSHTKSRRGCVNCKRRRIKCDETIPCLQCQRRDLSCHYLAPRAVRSSKTCDFFPSNSSDHPWVPTQMSSMELLLIENQYRDVLDLSPCAAASAQTSLVATLRHFDLHAYLTIGSPVHHRIFRQNIFRLSQDDPLLLHSIFAYAALHLSYLHPSDPRHAAEAKVHQSHAMTLLSRRKPTDVPPSKIDTWFGAYILLCGNTFYDPSDNPNAHASYLYPSNHLTSQAWNAISDRIGAILSSPQLKSHLPDSIWTPVLYDIDEEPCHVTPSSSSYEPPRSSAPNILDFFDTRPGPAQLDPDFISLCNITDESDAHNNPYHAALRALTPMLAVEPCVANFSKFITLRSRLSAEFRDLYYARDPAALLIMAHWFALITGIEHWWCRSRGLSECLAICSLLDGHPDQRVRRLLEYPARVCGYVPFDEEAVRTCVFGM